MPIVFARMQTVTRSSGRSMLDKIDYISRRGRYASRGGLVAGPVTVLPPGAPSAYRDERRLWSAAETAERYGHIMAQELLVALPRPADMPGAHVRKFSHSLARLFSEEYGLAVTYALHSDAVEPDGYEGEGEGEVDWAAIPADESNVHVHFLLGSRQLSAEGFSPRRHKALLPQIGGRSVSYSGAMAKFHVVDAPDFQSLVRTALEQYCNRKGLDVHLRLPAVHSGYHVGPTAATRALINDVEALARRPDAAAIFRKLERLRVNSEIELRNRSAVAEIEPLVRHLGDRIFTRREVEDLVRRHCSDPLEAHRIIEEVMARALVFVGAPMEARSEYYIMPQFRALERRIEDLVIELGGGSTGDHPRTAIKSFDDLLEVTRAQSQVLLLELLNTEHADTLEQLSAAMVADGRRVVMATHLHKRREPPPGIILRALHWTGDFVLPHGCTVLVDEADQLRPPMLERLLVAVVNAKANVAFCRRSYRGDVLPNPTLSAIAAGNHFALGEGAGSYGDLPFDLQPEKTLQFVDDEHDAVRLARELFNRTPAGRKVFFLCADPLVAYRIAVAGKAAKRTVPIGPSVPEDWNGAVVVVYTRLLAARHLRSIARLAPRFIVPRTVATDMATLIGQFRLSLGQVTTLREPVRTRSVLASPERVGPTRSASSLRYGQGDIDELGTNNVLFEPRAEDDPFRPDQDGIDAENDDPDWYPESAGPADDDDDFAAELNLETDIDDEPDDDPG